MVEESEQGRPHVIRYSEPSNPCLQASLEPIRVRIWEGLMIHLLLEFLPLFSLSVRLCQLRFF